MKNLKQNPNVVALALALTLVVAACSQGGSSGKGQTDQITVDVSAKKFRDAYRLVLNGCDTLRQEFGSDTSYDDVKKQVCAGLEDDKLNGSCAEPLRKDLFEKKCSGMIWTPNYEPLEGRSVVPVQDDSSVLLKEHVSQNLQDVLLTKIEVVHVLSPEDRQSADLLANDLMTCGMSAIGPKCLNYQTYAGNYEGRLDATEGLYVFDSEVRMKKMGSAVLEFKVDIRDVSHFKILSVKIFKVLRDRTTQPLDLYLKDKTAAIELLHATPAIDIQIEAQRRLKDPRGIRELYHMSRVLLRVSDPSGPNGASILISQSIAKNKNLLISSKDEMYQEQMLSLMTEVDAKKDVVFDICNGWLKSSSENVREIAATTILAAQPTRVETKPLVLKALENPRWDIRRKAVEALSKVEKTPEEEKALFKRVGDDDADVRKAAMSAVQKLAPNASQIDSSKELLKNENWDVRIQGVRALSRVDTPESKTALIGSMDDQDADVQSAIMKELSSKQINESDLSSLNKPLSSSSWIVRRDAAILVDMNSSVQASDLLISRMDDQDSDVTAKIYSLLEKRALTNDSVANLKIKFASANWQVRRNAAALLGKIHSSTSEAALRAQASVETDADVKNQITQALK